MARTRLVEKYPGEAKSSGNPIKKVTGQLCSFVNDLVKEKS